MIKFGPSGNCDSFYAEGYVHTEQSALFVKNRGLDCFEYSFGRGVRMSEDKAISIGEAFQSAGVEISVGGVKVSGTLLTHEERHIPTQHITDVNIDKRINTPCLSIGFFMISYQNQ